MRKDLKICLDIDGVLARFSKGVIDRAKNLGVTDFPQSCEEVGHWNMSPHFPNVMRDVWRAPSFWLNLEPLCDSIPFLPLAYITSRPVPSNITEQWLDDKGFPKAEVITVSRPDQKLRHLQRIGAEIFIDDLYSTIRQVRAAGINGILFKAHYQRGHIEECKDLPTIESLEEILWIK